MSDSDNRCRITFNGEIYNYIKLDEELRNLCYQFQGQSDTKVPLTSYRHWGKACLERLRGMFAFAIWDQKERSLFAARDRLGIKIFHYWIGGSRQLASASELKALLEFIPDRTVNTNLAKQFLEWNLLDLESSETMVSGIMRLSPKHALVWKQGEGLRIWRYGDLHVVEDLQETPEHETGLIGEFRQLFEETFSRHLRSGVPVETCLGSVTRVVPPPSLAAENLLFRWAKYESGACQFLGEIPHGSRLRHPLEAMDHAD